MLTLARLAILVDVFVLGVVEDFLQQAEQYNQAHVILDTQQIAPVTRQQQQPRETEQHVHDRHHQVKLQNNEKM